MAEKRIKPFRFWCQHVLPLVYDDSLSYYELLCKVVSYLNHVIEDFNGMADEFDALKQAYETLKKYVDEYFDNLDVQEEIDNKLDEMVADGTLSDIMERFLKKTPLRELVSCKPYAQVVPYDVTDSDTYWGQGFAIGEINGRPVAFHGCSSINYDGASCVVSEYFDTGVNIGKNEGSYGHANGATFCSDNNHFYVACAGGNDGANKVVEFDYQCNYIAEYNFDDMAVRNPYGIAWIESENCFVIACANNVIAKVNKDLDTVLSSASFVEQNDTNQTGQSLFVDDTYIYMINHSASVNDNSNSDPVYAKIDVYYISDMSYYCSQYVIVYSEFESACFYNDFLYLTTVTNRCIIIYEGSNKQDAKVFETLETAINSHNITQNVTVYNNVYVDTTATNFFLDIFDPDKPARNYWCFLRILRDYPKMGIRVYCRGDFSSIDINWKYRNTNYIRYTGLKDSNGNYPIFKNVSMYGVKCGHIENIQLVGVSSSYHITAYYCNYLYLSNVTFLEKTDAARFIALVATDANILGCTFNGQTTECLIRAVEGSSLLWDTNCEFNDVNYEIQGTSLINFPYRYPADGYASDYTQPSVRILEPTDYLDILSLKRSGNYRFEYPTTLVNGPSNLTDVGSAYFLIVNNTGGISYDVDSIFYVLGDIRNPNVCYLGQLYNNTIVWNMVGYLSYEFTNQSGGSSSSIYAQWFGGREVRLGGAMNVTSAIASGTTICDISDTPWLLPASNQYGTFTCSDGTAGVVKLDTSGLMTTHNCSIPTGTCCITILYNTKVI